MFKKLLTTNAIFLSIVFSGQIEFERFTIDNGLSQNTVYDVFQDSRGYLWMGTQGGLDRFNGYEFKQYEHESSDTTSIIDGWIRSIQEDEDGTLWLGTANGNFGWFNPFEEVGGEIDLYENHPGVQRPSRIDEILFYKDYIFLATIRAPQLFFVTGLSVDKSKLNKYFSPFNLRYSFTVFNVKNLILCVSLNILIFLFFLLKTIISCLS